MKSGATGAGKTCSGEWSGDWLNYMTTSRIDAMRKVLYGGLRSTDTATETVLQRAFIPQDAHSWGKEYTSVAVDGYELETRGTELDVTGEAKIVIRPERIELEPHGSPSGANRIPGMVERVVYVGSAIQVMVRAATGESLQALVQNTGGGNPYEQGTPVQLHLPVEALRVLPSGIGDAPSLKGDEQVEEGAAAS